MLRIIPRQDLSLANLVELDRQGFSVVKSPHPGNIYPNNLAVAALGIRILLHDRTYGRKDRNFHPHLVIADGKWEVIADQDLLMTHARVEHASTLAPQWIEIGERVAHCHQEALRQAVPGSRVELYTDYLHRRQELVYEILRIGSEVQLPPEYYWRRQVDEKGAVHRLYCRGWEEVERVGVYGLNGNLASGWIMPNVFNILVDAIIEALESGSSEVYHLSGPDMIKYIGQLEGMIARVYSHLLERAQFPLPSQINFHLVPVASMRLVTAESRQDQLDQVVEQYLELGERNSAVGRKIRLAVSNPERQSIISAWHQEKGARHQRLSESLSACSEIFYDIATRRMLTQYDLLRNGERVYVHPWGIQTPMEGVAKMVKDLERLR